MRIPFKRLTQTALILVLCAITISNSSVASAVTQNDLKSITNNTPFYDPLAGDCTTDTHVSSGGGSTGGATGSSGAAAWNSGVQPPYYLESYVINILDDLAKVSGVPTSDTVTQEHVVAGVAWAYAEGGNIANTGAFNIWNTGLTSRPDLVVGGTNASGLQSFKSFDAGVEANTISITGSNESRIGKILTDPTSTAEDVMHTIAYFDETPGNVAWAWGNTPEDPASVLTFNHTTYITSLTDNLSETRSDYATRASVEIGPGQEDTAHVTTPLQFKGGNGNGGTSVGPTSSSSAQCGSSGAGSPNCQSAVGNVKIICEARQYDPVSYSESAAGNHMAGGSPAWLKTCPVINASCFLDCSGLVNIAVYDAFGVDLQENTFSEVTDSKNWEVIPSINDAKPGDIAQPFPSHVIIIDHIDGTKITDFAASTSNVPQPDQVGQQVGVYSTTDSWYRVMRYIGPGHG